MLWLYILLIILALIIIIFIFYYNRFAVLGNRIDNSLSQIDVQLRKRADLVPNLMRTVKGYVKHEKSIFKQLTDARKELMKAKDLSAKMKAGNQLQKALKTIFALSESNPQLKSNENFLHLQQELSAIEDKIAYSRQYYNDSILTYNNLCKTFPGSFFASIYGKKPKPYLQIPQEAKVVPKVEF